jgi:hypothetical protein
MRSIGFCCLILIISIGCKHKKKEPVDNSNYFPVRAFLNSQVSKLDTSLFSITRIITANGVSDSTPIPRDSVRGLAREFLDIPDLRSEDGKDYTEIIDYDTAMQAGSWSYVNMESDIPKMQVFFVKSGLNYTDAVTTVYVEKEISKGDSLVQKRLLWDVLEHYFQVRTITSKKNTSDKIRDVRVIWQDFQSQ